MAGTKPGPVKRYPRCQKGHPTQLRADGTWGCTTCGRKGPSVVTIPLAADLIEDLQANPQVRFVRLPHSRRPYVVIEAPNGQ